MNRVECRYADINGYCDSTACHNMNVVGNIIPKERPENINIGNSSIWVKPQSNWHTGTPTEDGFYICKVHYGDIPDDMRILEWVRDMGCFCLPESKSKGYHFYVGDEGVEVVYEWQRLTMRFRKEHGGWLEPYKEK